METIIAILAGTALGTLIGFVYARSRNREMQNTIDRLDWQLKGEKANAEQ